MAVQIAGRLFGVPSATIPFTIEVVYDPSLTHTLAETDVDNSTHSTQGGANGEPADREAYCQVTIGHPGNLLTKQPCTGLAHEVFHCWQGKSWGVHRFNFAPPAPWVVEGTAGWPGVASNPPSLPMAKPAGRRFGLPDLRPVRARLDSGCSPLCAVLVCHWLLQLAE